MAEETDRKLPTKEQWEEIVKKLSGLFGHVELMVDEYKLTIYRARVSVNRLTSIVYVNGQIKAEWYKHHLSSDSNPEIPEEARRFYRRREKAQYSKEEIARAVRDVGKRRAKQWGYFERIVYYVADWPSATSLKRHLLANNHNIELIEKEGECPVSEQL